MSQVTALIDGNNFYASCEQSLDPSLSRQPLVVLSNNDGCIIARSSEARALGILMGTPYFKIHHKLEKLQVQVRSSNYALYADMSQRLMSILEANCEEIEIYSIDEAFALLHRPANGDLLSWARQLRAQVHQSLGIPIAIGIAMNKCQAKIANHTAKKIASHSGIFDLATEQNTDSWLESIDIENVWGIGRKLAQWCRLQNVNTARQFRDMPSGKLRAKYGVKAIRLQRELLGDTCIPLRTNPPPKKETCVSRSFKRPITQLKELQEAISTYVVRGGEKLRQQNQTTRSLTVFVQTSSFSSSFYSKSATTQLNQPTNDTTTLLKATMPLTEQVFRPFVPFIKAGILMQGLQTTKYQQQYLLANYKTQEHKGSEQLMATVDKINNLYGSNTVTWASCGKGTTWKMRRNRLSRASTTKLQDIPIAHA